MIDLSNLEQYSENNRIEAKKALGGLPHSIWETYSAFANTLGGIILLGVEEYRDKTLHTVDLPDPERLVREFWDLVNDPDKASANILSIRDVTIEQVNGDHIIVINVPRAERSDKPVYVEGNPLNTYRRSGEGDYRCTREEFQAMVRDASVRTQDMLVLERMELDSLNAGSIGAYRRRMRMSRPGHDWEQLEDGEFLMKLGAAGLGSDGQRHPTAAGLLMFGNEFDIVREYPQYFLDYREELEDSRRWTDRFVSSSGDWSGNVFDFYFRACDRLQLDLSASFGEKGDSPADETPVQQAIREALTNCMVNADYYGRGGLVVIRRRDEITLSNPGSFRIGVAAARSGGLSDPRNGTMLKMFNLIDIGEHAGSGIPNIFRVWRDQGWSEPRITQSLAPDRTTFSLSLRKRTDEPSRAGRADRKTPIRTAAQKEMIISYLTDHVSATSAELGTFLGLRATRVRELLRELIAENIVVARGGTRNRRYRLKA